MLDLPAEARIVDDLTIRVHQRMPSDWPSVRDASPAACHVFQTREFIDVWLATRGADWRGRALFVEVADRAGQRVMLLPLYIARRWGGVVLSFMDGGLADYNAPVLYPTILAWTEDTSRRLWERILAALPANDVVVLENVPRQVGGLVNPIAFVARGPNDESGHGSRLRLGWHEIEDTQFQLKTLKRKWRALERLGRVEFRVAETAQEIDRFLERAIAQKQRRFDESHVDGFDRDPAKLAYFQRATRAFSAAGRLQLCALMVNDEIVATAWNLVLGKRVYEIMIGFEGGEWTKYSCGRILNLMHLRWLHERGFDYLDHGIGDESWKLEYCDTHVELRKSIEARTGRGQAILARRRLVKRLKSLRAWRALQPLKWEILRRIAARRIVL